jgi:hypothetical protein
MFSNAVSAAVARTKTDGIATYQPLDHAKRDML